MSIEEILLSAEEHGKRFDVFKEANRIKGTNPELPLERIYEKAYQIIMKV
jgi:hypothetical protein